MELLSHRLLLLHLHLHHHLHLDFLLHLHFHLHFHLHLFPCSLLLHFFPPCLLDRDPNLLLGLLLLLVDKGSAHQMNFLLELLLVVLDLHLLGRPHPFLPVPRLSCLADLRDALHGHDRLTHDLAVVFQGAVPPPLQGECRVLGNFFAVGLTVGLSPFHLAGVPLHFEVLVALGPTELEDLMGGTVGGGEG